MAPLDITPRPQTTHSVHARDLLLNNDLRLRPVATEITTGTTALAPVMSKDLVVGTAGGETLVLDQAKIELDSITIGKEEGTAGQIDIGGSELILTSPSGGVNVGGAGSGAFYLGTPELPGKVKAAEGVKVPFTVRSSSR